MNRKSLILFCIIMGIIPIKASTNTNVLKLKSNSSNLLNSCLIHTIIQLFQFEKHLIIVCDTNLTFSFSVLYHLDSRYSISLKSKIYNFCLMSNYIIVSDRLSYLYEIFLNSQCDQFSRFLIITQISHNELVMAANFLLERGFVYVTFLVLKNYQNIMEMYQCKSDYINYAKSKLSFIGSCDLNHRLQIHEEIHPFRDIIYLCPINICKMRFIRVDHGATKEELYHLDTNSTKKADSFGACILEKFSEYYNIEITRAECVSNYTWFNAVQSIDNGNVDIIFGPTLPSENLVSHLQKGSYYAFEKFIFVDTIPNVLPTLFILILPLKMEVWICFIGVVISFLIFLKLLSRFKKECKIYEKLQCLHLTAIYFNQSVRLPKKLELRIIISSWLVYTFLMNAFYNCNFVSDVIKINPKNLMETFKDLRDSNRKIGGPDIAKEWLYEPNDSTIMDLYDRYEILEPDKASDALYTLGMAVAHTDYYVWKTDMLNVYTLKEDIVSYPLLYYAPNGHPYLKPISQFMEKIRAGHIPLTDCLSKSKNFNSDDEYNTIKMDHLQIIFKALFLFHLFSAVLCLVECVFFYITLNS